MSSPINTFEASVNEEKLDSPDKYFSYRLKKFMLLRNISQTQLAQETGITRQSISKYLNGELPSAKILIEIADYFDTTPNYLLGYSNIKDSSIVDDANAFNKLTSLSEESIKRLIEWNNDNSSNSKPDYLIMALDKLITSEYGGSLRGSLYELMYSVNKLVDQKAKFNDPEAETTTLFTYKFEDYVISEPVDKDSMRRTRTHIDMMLWRAAKDFSYFVENIVNQELGEDLHEFI